MIQKFLLLIAILVLSVSPALRAQDDEKRTIGILSFGYHSNVKLSVKGTLDMLQAYGYINQDERAVLDEQQDLEGESINIFWGDAGFDIGLATLMVRDALDKDPDALITITTPVTQFAANATLDMDDPPLVIFNVNSNPYAAGIASAPCIKPATSPVRSFWRLMIALSPCCCCNSLICKWWARFSPPTNPVASLARTKSLP